MLDSDWYRKRCFRTSKI